ncbi:unnamed protein product [Tenebrio molitor]|nr:unnamed protein product [Tenebrio molitor]
MIHTQFTTFFMYHAMFHEFIQISCDSIILVFFIFEDEIFMTLHFLGRFNVVCESLTITL